MKKWIINMGILTGIWMALTGCRALKTQAVMDTEMAEEEETESQVWPGLLGEPGKKAEEIVSFLEQFEGGLSFRDMLERQVRFTPPDTEAYLAVEMERAGELCTEYVPLTREEEREILDSEEPVPLEDGGSLEFFVSQETYEEQDIDGGAVTAPALRIAEERCGFRPAHIESDMDIEKKEETREEEEKENEGEAGEETGEEKEEAREEAGEESEEAREEAGERAREAMEDGEADGD